MDDRSKDSRNKEQASRAARWLRRLRRWRLHQQLARGMAYGVGSGAVSLLVLYVRSRY